jgi:chlorite dismutase
MFRVRWPAWKALAPAEQQRMIEDTTVTFSEMEQGEKHSALFSLVGHKGDLLVLHFRKTFDELNEAELQLAQLRFAEFLEPTTSYLSVVELGLYDASTRLYVSLQKKGVQPGTAEWQQAIEAELTQQRRAAAPRLWPKIPPRRYLCFYPMDKKRGEHKNWYQAPIADRHLMMRDHGMIGRKYAGQVTQIISGSIGFDDWEWGVDLFADDPLVFKKLVYEMRFDEASAVYGLFGTFYVGLQFPAKELGTFLSGKAPVFVPE